MSEITLQQRRGRPGGGGNPSRFIELVGGEEVLMQSYEPDPVTARVPYYYNTRLNKLFKRMHSISPVSQKMTYFWQNITEC